MLMKRENLNKILLIWNGMAASQVSGGDIYTKKIIESSDMEFDVILPSRANNILTGHNVRDVYITDSKSAGGNAGLLILYLRRTLAGLRYVKKNKSEYSSVIVSTPFIYDLIPAIATKNPNKIVILFHLLPKRKGTNLATRVRFFLAYVEQKLALKLIKKYFTTIMAGNEEVKKELKKRFPDKKIVTAHAGIDTEKIDVVKSQGKDPDLGLFVGRLTVQKGILDLVDVAKAIEKKHPNFKLILLGDGPDRELLEKKISKEGVTCISLKGFVDEPTKYELMKNAKFFLFPSREEGWGIALAEALYCGCLSLCYELPHYRGLFKEYPEYIKLADSKEMGERLVRKYTTNPKSDQQQFIKQYDDKLVVKSVLSQIYEG